MADIVAAKSAFVVTIGDRPFVVRAGDLFLADDPLVRRSPDRFTAPRVRTSPPARSKAKPPSPKKRSQGTTEETPVDADGG